MKVWTRLLLTILLAFVSGATIAQRGLPASLHPQPRPDLGEMQPPIRKWIEGLQNDLEGMISTPKPAPAKLAEASGSLGNFYQSHGLNDAAETLYLNAALLAPTQARWPYFLGLIYTDRNDYVQAEASFNKVLELRPDDQHALIRLGGVMLLDNRLEEAQDYLQRALDKAPDSARVLYNLGEAAMGLDDAASAVFYFEKALSLQPQATLVHYPLGLAYRKLGNIEKARYHIQRRGDDPLDFSDPYTEQLAYIVTLSTLKVALSMAADRDSFSARDFMGYINTHLRGKPGLVAYFEAAIEDKKRIQPSAKIELARLYFAVGNLLLDKDRDRAHNAFSQATQLDASFPEPFIELSNILIEKGRAEEALETCNRLLARYPEHADGLFSRANLLAGKGNLDLALSDLEKLLSLEPEKPSTRLLFAQVLEAKGNIEGARHQLETTAGFDLSDDEMALVKTQLGRFLQRHNQHAAARQAFEDALARQPELVDVRLNLAGLLAFTDRFEEAIEHYDRVLETDPTNEGARLGQVAALILSNHIDRAYQKLEEAHKLLTESLPLAHLLARMLAAAPRVEFRDGARALDLAHRVFEKQRSFAHAETLAMALAQAGRFDEARNLQARLTENAGENVDLATALQANLALYEEKKPCCAQPGPNYLLP